MLLTPSWSFSPSSHPNLCLCSLLWVGSLISSAFSRYSGSGVPASICLVGESKKEKKRKLGSFVIDHLEKAGSPSPPESPSLYLLHRQIPVYSSKQQFWGSHHMVECVKAKSSTLVVKTQEGCQGPAGCSRNNGAKMKREWDVEKTKQGAEPCKIPGRSHRNGGLLLAALGIWVLGDSRPNVQLSCEGTAEAEANNRCHSDT